MVLQGGIGCAAHSASLEPSMSAGMPVPVTELAAPGRPAGAVLPVTVTRTESLRLAGSKLKLTPSLSPTPGRVGLG
jgi:hypothetical protein